MLVEAYFCFHGYYDPVDHGVNMLSLSAVKVLRSVEVDVSGEVMEHLSEFPLLELNQVHGTRSLVNLRIAGPSLALKHLDLHCSNEVKSIEICDAPNLMCIPFLQIRRIIWIPSLQIRRIMCIPSLQISSS